MSGATFSCALSHPFAALLCFFLWFSCVQPCFEATRRLGEGVYEANLLFGGCMWRAAVAGGVEFVPGQVITTGTNPLAKDTQYEAIQRFQEVMRAYLTHSGQKYYADKDHFLKDDGDGEMMVAGWIAGEVLSQALGSREWVKDRKSFLVSLYNQRRYVVDNIVI
ncbi:receptor-type adenylate cyclase, putative, partial [Trypanosoma cruzi]